MQYGPSFDVFGLNRLTEQNGGSLAKMHTKSGIIREI